MLISTEVNSQNTGLLGMRSLIEKKQKIYGAVFYPHRNIFWSWKKRKNEKFFKFSSCYYSGVWIS
jgi:hypothetical protein